MFLSNLLKWICRNASLGLKSLGKVDMNGNKACFEIGIRLKKLNTPVKTR
jgi:hypothetical protein